MKMIYYALFHSHLVYGIHIWSSCPEAILKQITIKQKIAIRILAKAKYNSHTEPLFKKLEILPFNLLCDYFKLQFMQRFTQNYVPTALENMWVTNSTRHADEHIQLRNDDFLYIPFARSITTERLPLTYFPRLWNEFPDGAIKFIRNKIEFNQKLKCYFLNLLNSTVICNRLLCPDCHLRPENINP